MGQPIVLFDNWSQGMKRDFPRDDMPPNSAWNLVDYIPGLGAPLRRRQGWDYASPDLSTFVSTGATYVAQVAHAPFSGGTKLVAIDEDGVLYNVVSAASAVSAASGVRVGKQPPFMHRNKLIILDDDGTSAPQYYDGSSVAALSASAPAAIFGCVYKDRLVLGNTSADPQTVFFSGAGDPTSWTVTSEINVSYPITGMAALRNSIIVFSDRLVERIIGNTPPPGTDMIREPLYEGGTTDCRSIVLIGEQVIWANPSGVYLTDGAAVDDLTEAGGIKTYWQELLSGYDTDWTIVASHFQSYYIVSIMDGATPVSVLVCDVQDKIWFSFSNLDVVSFARAYTTQEELYAGLRTADRVIALGPCFQSHMDDADGGDDDDTDILPELETPYHILGSPGEKSIKRVYLEYMLHEPAAGAEPELEISYIKTPHAASYTALATTFGMADTITRKRLPLGFGALGVAFKLVQKTNESMETHIHRISVEAHPREGSNL